MSFVDILVERNREYAATRTQAGDLMPLLSAQLPHVKALVIGCADMRVDPEAVLGLKAGEAVVVRNIGGRITPGLLEQLGMLGRIGQVADAVPGGGGEFHVMVLHHTDCGIKRLARDPAMLANYFQIAEERLVDKSVTDPRAAVAADVTVLRAVPALPADWLVSGLVYDVSDGRVEVVVPPSPLR